LTNYIQIGRKVYTEEDAWAEYIALADKLSPKEEKVITLRTLGETIEAAQHIDDNPGLSTGYPTIDGMVKGGIRPSELVVLFGDTGHGKSQLCQNIAFKVASDGKPVLFVGFEMTDEENTIRFQGISGQSYEDIELLPILYPPEGIKLAWDDMDQLVRLAVEARAELVVIDHLHAMSLPPGNTRADQLEAMMYEFKGLARKYKIPVIVVSHTSRRQGENSPPHLTSLKGSGGIEQVADIAIGVWRTDEQDAVLQVYTDKFRRGPKQQKQLTIGKNAQLLEPTVLEAVFPGVKED
jgi:replicative DNA helicase